MKRNKIINSKSIGILILLCLLFTTQISLGQSLEDALGFEETVDDVPEAPIHGLVILGLAAGAVFGYRKIKK